MRCTTVGNTATPTTSRQKWTRSTLDASVPKSTAISVTSEMPPGTAQTRQVKRSEYPLRNSSPPTATLTSSSEAVIMRTGRPKVFSWRKSSRPAEQPMKTPATTWAMCLKPDGTVPM